MRKAAAYARVSTLHQSDLSLVGQFEECDRYAESNEIEIVAYFADKETGKVNRREQLDELIDHANRRESEYILVDDFDRFCRAGARGEVFIQDLEEKSQGNSRERSSRYFHVYGEGLQGNVTHSLWRGKRQDSREDKSQDEELRQHGLLDGW